jgi:hypothetical protein
LSNSTELDAIIQEVKHEFRLMLIKRRELIQRLGNAFEKIVSDLESICEEIKNCLKDEIADKIISARDIERYCPEKWKNKTKPERKNDKLSFSQKSHHKKSATIAIDTKGRPVQEEVKSVNRSSSPPPQEENESKGQEVKIQDGIFDGHTFPYYQELLVENQRIHKEKQKIEEGLAQALETIEQQRETINELSHTIESHYKRQSQTTGEVLDVEVPLLYRPLQEEMQSIHKLEENRVWLTIRVDRNTGNIAGVFLGRKSQGRTLGHSIVTSYV